MRRRTLVKKRSVDNTIGYEFVDMGLSVMWATCNIGAISPEEYGWYFMWGDTTAYGSDRKPIEGGSAVSFNWTNYPLCNGSITSMKKYNSSSVYGTVDNKTILEPEDDAAHVHIGEGCRMPTKEEYDELIAACNMTWVSNYNNSGINGRLFTLKTDPSKTLFFPASGELDDARWINGGSHGKYWSSSLFRSYPYEAQMFDFVSGNYKINYYNRYYGYSVRAVLPPPPEPPIEASKAEACDVVFAQQDGSLVIRRDQKDWRSDEEPIGIVVIPGSHGVLKDGTGTKNHCGVMSIVPMDYSTPETGATSEGSIYWGYNSLDISGKSDGLGRYDSVTNGLQNYSGSTYIDKQSEVGGIPSGGDINPYKDTNSGLSNERNASYGTSGYLSDFSGVVNTKIITDQVTVSNWKTISTISNSSSAGNYPAACCCARYKTTGTKAFVDCNTDELKKGKGFWYLPAAGELGYIIPRLYDINDTISKLNTAYGVGVQLGTVSYHWSSSECDTQYAYYVYTNTGCVISYRKNSSNRVRAFMQLGSEDIKEEPEDPGEITTPTGTTVITLDQTKSDPYQMLSGEFGKDGNPSTNVISWIRANSHRYVGEYNSEDGMVLRQLEDTDGTLYADDWSDATNDLQTKDVFMKMPDFWFKGVPLLDQNADGDIVEMHFSAIDPQDESWTKWEGNRCIGVYEAQAENGSNDSTGGLFSRSNKFPNGNISRTSFRGKARTRTVGDDHFRLVTYESHQIMALLYMAYYGNTNGQLTIGYGTASYANLTGKSDTLGMKDSTEVICAEKNVTNFWGLENWWGDMSEHIDNLVTVNTTGRIEIRDYAGTAIRISTGPTMSTSGNISKLRLTENLDVIPSNKSGSQYEYFCDNGFVTSSNSNAAARSYYASNNYAGPFCLIFNNSATNDTHGTRLQYEGRCKVLPVKQEEQQPEPPSNGVYIEDVNGILYTKEEWANQSVANSIVVVDGSRAVRMALEEPSGTLSIHSSKTKDFTDIQKYSDENTAVLDFSGKENTESIVKIQPSTDYAAGWCINYTFPDGKTKGYLPSLGEWMLCYKNKEDVDKCLELCNSKALTKERYYWSSTLYGFRSTTMYGWVIQWNTPLYLHNTYIITDDRRVRPFAEYTLPETKTWSLGDELPATFNKI